KRRAKPGMTKPPRPPIPEITLLEPHGVQSGTTTKIKLSGKNLAGIKEVKFSAGGLSATVTQDEKGMGAELAITAGDKVPRSQVEMSVVTATGESAKQKLFVDYLPQIVAPASQEPVVLDKL